MVWSVIFFKLYLKINKKKTIINALTITKMFVSKYIYVYIRSPKRTHRKEQSKSILNKLMQIIGLISMRKIK